MIKPEELRIGNWVKWLNEKEPNTAEWSHGHWLGVHHKNYPFPEPIQLTEEWLIKFGFVLIDENPFPHLISLKYWVYDGVCLFFNEPQQDEPSWLLGVADQRMGAYHLVTIRWIDKVHEIQNAYFGIKGRELKLA